MPVYEFKCKECKHCFERLILRSDRTVSCPNCHSGKVDRQLSAFSFKVGGGYGKYSEQAVTGSSGSSCASCVSRNCSQCR
ncbi:zinc ribbon domain-containing protein [bacterium]|nr:zinc ribbon domain-containing protein [bacterium]